MSTSQNRLQKERNQKQLLELASQPGNNICADCKARLPRWASHSLGIFICVNCASIHRKIGTHITKVKSLTMDDWTKEQIEFMKSMGNEKSNSIYNPNELRHPPPPNIEDSERDSEIEQYIRSKYEYRKFIDRSALVASRLGPSRSASTLTSRSVPSPLTSSSQTTPSSQSASNVRPAATSDSTLQSSNPRAPSHPSTTHISQQPQTQTRSVSYPSPLQTVHTSQTRQPQQQQNPLSGLGSTWEDIQSLARPGQTSSLPLQYQTSHPTQPHVNGAIGANGYPVGVTSAGMGMNPFSFQQGGINPYSQQQSQSPFSPPPMTSPYGSQNPPMSPALQSYSQSTSPAMNQIGSPAYFQTQAQTSLQTPSPSFVSSSPSQGFLSPSASSQPFLSSSPSSQFLSSSSGSQFLSSSPSQQFGSHSPQPQMQQPQSQAQFAYQGSMSQPAGQFGGNISGQAQFLGMTTMQMQQQQMQLQLQQQQQLQQPQQMQSQQFQQQPQQMQPQQFQQQQPQQQQQQQLAQQGMYASNQPQQMMYGQMFPQGGGYSTQGGQQQWGAM